MKDYHKVIKSRIQNLEHKQTGRIMSDIVTYTQLFQKM